MFITSKYINKLLPSICDNIMDKLFSSETNNIKSMLSTAEKLNGDISAYEFEVRFVDENNKSCSKKLWKDFSNRISDMIFLDSYADDIVYTHNPTIPIQNVTFRTYKNTNTSERKILLSTTHSNNLRIKLSKESVTSIDQSISSSISKKYINIQRRQRASYLFKKVADDQQTRKRLTHNSYLNLLTNWRIDKTVRLITTNENDSKLTINIPASNIETLKYYDILDIEFEYIGTDFSELTSSFFALINLMYDNYTEYNLTYKLISSLVKQLYSVDLSNIFPSVSVMTTDMMLTEQISKYIISMKMDGERKHVVIFNGIIYEMDKYKFIDVAIDENIPDIFLSRNTTSTNISIFDVEKMEVNGETTYYIFDVFAVDGKNVSTLDYKSRISSLNQIILYKNFLLAPPFDNYEHWSDLVKYVNQNSNSNTDGLICRLNSATFTEGGLYKLKNKKLSTLDFYLVLSDNKLYLYNMGCVDSIIKQESFENEKLQEHFGYNSYSALNKYLVCKNTNPSKMFLTSTDNIPSNGQIYILYSTPYFQDFKYSYIDAKYFKEPLSQYDRKIVECKLDPELGWLPVKIRADKTYPNSYNVSLSVSSLLYSDTMFDAKHNATRMPKLDKICHTLISQYIHEKIFHNTTDVIIFISPYVNGAQFTKNFVNIKNVYLYSFGDKESIISYINTYISSKASNIKSLAINDSNKTLNVAYTYKTTLGITNFELLDSLDPELIKRKKYFKIKSIDVMFIDHGINEICESIISMIDFKNYCDLCLSANGKLVIKYIDATTNISFMIYDSIFKNAGSKSVVCFPTNESRMITISGKNIISDGDENSKKTNIFKIRYQYDNMKFTSETGETGESGETGETSTTKPSPKCPRHSIPMKFIDIKKYYSIFHNVDKFMGSSGYSQNAMMDDNLNENVMLELMSEALMDYSYIKELKHFIKIRSKKSYVTIIVCEVSELVDKLCRNNFMKLTYDDSVDIYISKNSFGEDHEIFSMINNFLTYKIDLNLNVETLLSVFSHGYEIEEQFTPFTQYEIVKYMSASKEFSSIGSLSDELSSIRVVILSKTV